MKPVLSKISDTIAPGPDVLFQCPGCKMLHGVRVDHENRGGSRWTWNGSLDRPTFQPSVLVKGSHWPTDDEHEKIMRGEKVLQRDFVCHSFVSDGQIQFLPDCTHALAGQTVPLPEVDS